MKPQDEVKGALGPYPNEEDLKECKKRMERIAEDHKPMPRRPDPAWDRYLKNYEKKHGKPYKSREEDPTDQSK